MAPQNGGFHGDDAPVTPSYGLGTGGGGFDDDQTDPLARQVAAPAEAPAQAAKVNTLATQFGVSPDFVRENMEDLEHRVRLKGFDAAKFRATSPALAAWLEKHPEHIPVAREDVPALGFFETMSRKAANLYWSAKAGESGAVEGLASALQTGIELVDHSATGEALRRSQGLRYDTRREFVDTLDALRR